MKIDDYENFYSEEYWWPKIRNFAKNFYESLKKIANNNSVIVDYNPDKLEEALQMYKLSWNNFKKHIYQMENKDERIDRHKIASLYILSLLTKRPFYVIDPSKECGDEDKRIFFLANELFSLMLMQSIIFCWRDEDERKKFDFPWLKKDRLSKIEYEKRKWFMILLNYFKRKYMKLNHKKSMSDMPSDIADFLSLAQVIYYIEQSFLK